MMCGSIGNPQTGRRRAPPDPEERRPPAAAIGTVPVGVVLGLCALLVLGAGRLWDGTSPAAVPGGDRVQTPFQPGAELLDQLQALAREEPAAEALLACPEDYPEELLELAVRNPEALDFVVRYPERRTPSPPPLWVRWSGGPSPS